MLSIAPTIHIQDLTLNYQNKPIFSELSTCFPGGKFSILLGASGVGKSSLLKMIAGLLPITQGQIISDHPETMTHQISYMAQQDLLMPWATVLKNVMLGSKLRKEKADKNRAQDILKQVGLSQVYNQYPAQLSGGMRQRAALARTLYEDRSIILMDEPFSALDSVTRAKMQDYTAKLLKGKTVILITHDPFEACRLGEHIQVLAGNPVQIYDIPSIQGAIPRHPEDLHVQQAQANLLTLLIEKSTLS
ncbi:ABC transporter ATP-binding protein [Commensalibacter papalotli (ex Servin-Garciduenas et al. 2014)]|uniref:ABC transporter-like protein n=1 Tax=Commensalibacter papalotli (ex Servin-Garciduenas et al. 2014) TaxID=1208583 RepID=W7E5S9_9PROT|nr:ABC transporter ATP-binding protein [Commensalibacter papalotli (ex Servin-Garciduenas et al. 2014)]EUK18436.1 ABC transporter-like protein [Commensalibacter papalotli (ex Servin-Garciduenas et al. 2014)]